LSGQAQPFRIDRLGAAGDGVAETPAGPVFVAGALPGENVLAIPGQKRGEGMAATLVSVTTASADRVAPPCPHFRVECGACALQHLAEIPYAAWKVGRLAEALSRAGMGNTPIAPLVVAASGSRRRADLALRRTPSGVALGFHARGSAAVADIVTCHVLDLRLVALFRPLREMLRRLNALKREGSAVLNLLDSGPDLLLRTDGVLDAAGRSALAAFGAAHGMPRIAWAKGEGAPETAAQAGPVRLRFGTAEVAPPPGAFLQSVPAGEAAIIAAVLAGLPAKLPAKAHVADLYAGLGTLSFPLATRARVTAFEGDAPAAAALDAGARKAGGRVTAVRRDLAQRPLLPVELAPFDAVVLDPPFTGAAEQVAQIARSKVTRVIYVSCNPGALSRDLAILGEAGFVAEAATPIDQFRWSAHLEAVVTLTRGGMRNA
jgi:23S rRNA (uracil1939-C5)-methyltransferase